MLQYSLIKRPKAYNTVLKVTSAIAFFIGIGLLLGKRVQVRSSASKFNCNASFPFPNKGKLTQNHQIRLIYSWICRKFLRKIIIDYDNWIYNPYLVLILLLVQNYDNGLLFWTNSRLLKRRVEEAKAMGAA